METLLTIVHVAAAIFMIVVIIIQGGNSGGVGAAFGGGNSTGLFGASGATSFLGKLTYAMAAVFMVTSIWLSVEKGNSGNTGLTERLKQTEKVDEKPATPSPSPSAVPEQTPPP
jgi:preprotein translocase subunit SecG